MLAAARGSREERTTKQANCRLPLRPLGRHHPGLPPLRRCRTPTCPALPAGRQTAAACPRSNTCAGGRMQLHAWCAADSLGAGRCTAAPARDCAGASPTHKCSHYRRRGMLTASSRQCSSLRQHGGTGTRHRRPSAAAGARAGRQLESRAHQDACSAMGTCGSVCSSESGPVTSPRSKSSQGT